MTDLDETAHRLRAALDELVSDVPAVPRHQPAFFQPAVRPAAMAVDRPRLTWQRSLAMVSVVVVAAGMVAAVAYDGPRSRPSGPTVAHRPGRPAHPLHARHGWIYLPLLLPTGGATVSGAMVATGPVPVPSTGTYEQSYQGPQTVDPPQLLITTVRAQPGALTDYAANSQTVDVHGGVGYLTNFSDHQLVWQTADGVVVSLESTALRASDVVAAAQLVDPRPAAQLGVVPSGPLPDGLALVGEGFASGDTAQSDGDAVFFRQGSCRAYTQVWAGSPADFAPVAIVSESYRVVSVRGARGQLDQISPSTWALLWPEEPGIDVRLQGEDCDLTSIAAGLKAVNHARWRAQMSSLGSLAHWFTAQAPTPSATLPGPGTYGLAH